VSESGGLAEKYRAVIDGETQMMNRSAEGGERSSPPQKGEGVSRSLHRVKVSADGTVRTNSDVTSGEPVRSAGWHPR
jgi:hypothetical protein